MWPVYLVTMHLAALWIIFTLNVGHVPSEAADSSTPMSYVRQVLLVQLWFQPFFDGSSWDGPAWSISAEWLAYLMFGVLVLVIFRIARATRARGLICLAVAASLPPVLLLMATGHVLHAVELVAAHRHAVHRGRPGVCRRSQAAADGPGPAQRRISLAAARRARSSASCIYSTRIRYRRSPTRPGWSTCCSCRWC